MELKGNELFLIDIKKENNLKKSIKVLLIHMKIFFKIHINIDMSFISIKDSKISRNYK